VLEIGTSRGINGLAGVPRGAGIHRRAVHALAESAQQALRAAAVRNVSVLLGDGTLGWSAFAPYEAILVAAGGPEVPAPLIEQLALGGRLLIPLGDRGAQTLTLVERTMGEPVKTTLGTALFVPLVGEHGFDA
jgi:protein-L-isoaspartate(D-aspartate) O-methyltransferase